MLRATTSCAVRPLGLLAGGVGADGRPLDEGGRVDAEDAAAHLDAEHVEAARRRAALLLTDPVVLRAVARALEPLGALAERDPAAEVHALLVEGDDALLHPVEHGTGVDGLRLADGVARVG